jgi:hypothetical protein
LKDDYNIDEGVEEVVVEVMKEGFGGWSGSGWSGIVIRRLDNE